MGFWRPRAARPGRALRLLLRAGEGGDADRLAGLRDGLILSGWVLYESFVTHTAILGWPSLMIAICLIGGALLMSVGILGEYVVRIYDEVRPPELRRRGGDPLRRRASAVPADSAPLAERQRG